MKKSIILALLLVLVIELLGGCSFPGKGVKPPVTTPGTGAPGEQAPSDPSLPQPSFPKGETGGQKKSSTDGVLIGKGKMPAGEILPWAESYLGTYGVYQKNFGNYRVYLIAAGEKPTGGYSVEIDQVGLTPGPGGTGGAGGGNRWIIDVVFKEPPPGAIVTQALTYPYELVAVPADGNEVVIREVRGTRVRTLPIVSSEFVDTSKYIRVEAPLPGSLIRSPVLIMGKAQVFEATLIVVIEDGHNELARQVVTATAGAPEWGEFSVRLPFARPTNQYGTIIVYTESAKDGSIEHKVTLPVRFD